MRRHDGVRADRQAEHLTVLAEAAELSSTCDRVLGKHTKMGGAYRQRLKGGRGGLVANLRSLQHMVPAARERLKVAPPTREDLEKKIAELHRLVAIETRGRLAAETKVAELLSTATSIRSQLHGVRRDLADERRRSAQVEAGLRLAEETERAAQRYANRVEQKAMVVARELWDARVRIFELENPPRRSWWSRLLGR